MPGSSYDFVIVGGGSAGCALANRLSADPSNRVLVLEAGPMDRRWDFRLHMPAALTYPLTGRAYNWWYESDPEPGMGGRRIYQPRGKVLGGSSSINGMIFQRGNPLDYDIRAQTHSVINNVRVILEAHGSSLDDVVDVLVFLVDMERDFPDYNEVYSHYFEEILPARTTVAVEALPTSIAIELKVIAKA